MKYGLDPQEAALTEGVLPGTPHWGEEDESSWGLLHTERDGKVVRESYPSLPGNYAAFLREYLSAYPPRRTFAERCPRGDRSHPLDRGSLGKQPYAACGSYLIENPLPGRDV